jgi:hypothetical protein
MQCLQPHGNPAHVNKPENDGPSIVEPIALATSTARSHGRAARSLFASR